MIFPERSAFQKLADTGKYIPMWVEILGDMHTPVSVYKKLQDLSEYSYLLESVQQDEKLGRFSFIGLNPLMVFKSKGQKITVNDHNGNERTLQGNPLDVLFDVMEGYRITENDDLDHFNGGLVGYFGYDAVRFIEKLPDQNPDDLQLPESLFMLPESILVFDSIYQTLKLVTIVPGNDSDAWEKGKERLEMLLGRIQSDSGQTIQYTPIQSDKEFDFKSNMTPEEYMEGVEKARKYIYEGDIFQVVLSQRFSMDFKGDAFEIYRSLRRINPSPYLFYLQYPDFQVAGSSPEILVKKEADKLTLRPIAGTRKRGKTEEEDQQLEAELLNDPKEIAEHMMLLDLGRNDLGRISEFGSVHPTDFLTIENYSHVKHIVTNLEGKAQEGVSAKDVLNATFPAGTLSGAPKVRAMEIIDELEVNRRGFYGGAVCNIDFKGNLDACIGIRSVVVKNQKAYIQAGAGVVADSVPENEHDECLNKAKAVMRAVNDSREDA